MQIYAIEQVFQMVFSHGEVILFGSRADDQKKGGDIDLFIQPAEVMPNLFARKIQFLRALKNKIGEQKIDLVLAPYAPEALQREIKNRDTAMSNINEQKLVRLFRECDIHQARMVSAYQKIQYKLPLQSASYLQLNEEDITHIDQFLFRYAKLQDAMGKRLFKAMLILLQEEVEHVPFLDILHKLEQLNLIASAEKWQELREIRNAIDHEYDDSPELMVQMLNAIFSSKEVLIDIYDSLKDAYQKRHHDDK
ncbi:MAG: nucleotidyltransferase domain-containing protein [Ghiorsea sp.]|nr:nucleotidyltransferase domain-containing protein [Ghiorsea sp.]